MNQNNITEKMYNIRAAREGQRAAMQGRAMDRQAKKRYVQSLMTDRAGDKLRRNMEGAQSVFDREMERLRGLEGEIASLTAQIVLKSRQLQRKKMYRVRELQYLRGLAGKLKVANRAHRALELREQQFTMQGNLMKTMAQNKLQNVVRSKRQGQPIGMTR